MMKKSYIVIARSDFCDKAIYILQKRDCFPPIQPGVAMTGSLVFQHPVRLRKNPQKDFSGALSADR